MYLEFERTRNACGHWDWQYEDLDGLEPGYRVCPICDEMGPYAEKIRKQNHEREQDEHGLTFAWFPPRADEEETNG